MTKKFVRLTLQVDIDKDLLYDDQTLQAEFDNSTEKLIVWMLKEEGIWELITFADNPVIKKIEEIEVE